MADKGQHLAAGHALRRHQRHRGDDLPGVAHGGGAHLLPLLNGGLDALGQVRLHNDAAGVHAVGQHHGHVLPRCKLEGVLLPGVVQGHVRQDVPLGGDGLAAQVQKGPAEQGRRVQHLPVDVAVHRGAAQAGHNVGVAPIGGGGHNAVTRLVVGAGLDAGGVGVVVGHAIGVDHVGQHAVGGVGRADVLLIPHGMVVVGRGGGDFRKVGQAHGVLGDGNHVPGRGVVVLVVQAVGIGEMGVGAAQLLGLLVHQLDEVAAAGVVAAVEALLAIGRGHGGGVQSGLGSGGGLGVIRGPLAGGAPTGVGAGAVLAGRTLAGSGDGTGGRSAVELPLGVELVHVLGQGQGGVVAGGDHHQVEQIQAGERLPHVELRHRAAGAGQLIHHALGDGDLGVFNVGDGLIGHNVAHDFSQAGHGQLLVGVVAVNRRVGIQVEHEIGLAVGAVGVVGILVPAVLKALCPGGHGEGAQQAEHGQQAGGNSLTFLHGGFLSLPWEGGAPIFIPREMCYNNRDKFTITGVFPIVPYFTKKGKTFGGTNSREFCQ